MKINTVLLWVTYVSLAMFLGLILMILHGSIGFDSEWIQPTTIATLIGGLGGALAGTWLSGRNANKQWEKQEAYRLNVQREIALNKKSVFNTLVYAELKNIELNATMLVLVLTIEDNTVSNAGENKNEVIKLFYEYLEEVSYCVSLIENAYREAKALLHTDLVDYEIFDNISDARVRTYELFVLSNKHEHNLQNHLKILEKSNSKYHEMVVLQAMIGINISRKTIIKLNEFFIEREKYIIT